MTFPDCCSISHDSHDSRDSVDTLFQMKTIFENQKKNSCSWLPACESEGVTEINGKERGLTFHLHFFMKGSHP